MADFAFLQILTKPLWLLPLAGIMGLVIGSFLTVVAHRLPRQVFADEGVHETSSLDSHGNDRPAPTPFNIAWPGSHCPHCKTPLRIWQNIPLMGFLIQRGRCVDCNGRISMRYPLIETITAVAFLALAWRLGFGLQLALALVFAGYLVALSAIDIDHYILPDQLTLSLVWIGLLVNSTGLFVSIESAVWGAALGYASLWLIHHVFLWIRKKEGLGYGDFKLLAAIGAWLGIEALPWVLFGAASAGAIVGIAAILIFKRGHDAPLPFGPFISAAGFGALLYFY